MTVLHLLRVAAWTLVMLAAFFGWGSLVSRLVHERASWAERAAWGIALSMMIGGVLNLFALAVRPVLFAWVVAGAVIGVALLFAGEQGRDDRASVLAGAPGSLRASRDPVVAALVIGASLLVMITFLGTVAPRVGETRMTAVAFNPHDDFQGYLVFAERLSTTGHIGRDPWNERRLSAGLGGMAFLNALMMLELPPEALHVLDPTMGLMLVLVLVVVWGEAVRAPPRATAVIQLLIALLTPPTVNVSALAISAALLMALALALDRALEPAAGRRALIPVVLLTAATCVLKSTVVIPALLLPVVAILAARRRDAWPMLAIVFGGVFLLVLPWSIAEHLSSGTFLYPVLGRGTRGVVPDPSSWMTLRHAAHLILWPPQRFFLGAQLAGVAAFLHWLRGGGQREMAVELALAVAMIGGTLAIALGLDGFDTYRMAYPIVVTALAAIALSSLAPRAPTAWRATRTHSSGAGSGRTHQVASVLALCAVTVWGVSLLPDARARQGAFLRAMVEEPRLLVSPAVVQAKRALQSHVPAGEPLLTRDDAPFVFDFNRNPVYAVDWPYGAAPRDSMPAFRGAEPLAQFLAAAGVRWLEYSYASQAGFSAMEFIERLQPDVHPWQRDQARFTLNFQSNLDTIGMTRRRIVDDGHDWIVDLCTHPDGSAASTAPVCAQIPVLKGKRPL